MKEKMRAIEIDEAGRYILLVYSDTIGSEQINRVTEALKEWWESGEKFFGLLVDDVEVAFERVENE